MKRIIIGRATDSDIVIPDEHDNVSRHHAVISFDFFGRMTLSDTSSNGTLINGTRMLKGASVPVTRNDKIQLGGAWIFDWELVEDPYKKIRQVCYIVVTVLLLLIVGFFIWNVYTSQQEVVTNTIITPKTQEKSSGEEWNKDSTNKVAPTEISISTSNKQHNVEKSELKRKKKSSTRVTVNKSKKNRQPKGTLKEIHNRKDYSAEKEMPAVN